jgi:aryl-alcohol dehydrogenase (NADP+)
VEYTRLGNTGLEVSRICLGCMSIIPWSPLARGRLARQSDEATPRSELDEFGRRLYSEEDRVVVDRVGEIAERRGIPRARVALAWLLAQPGVTSPIVGATKPHHLDDAVGAVEIELTPEEIASLQEPYRPHPILGHQ